jgi:flagellin
MGLRINQNPAAMNAYRSLNVTDGQMSKSLEKLSSGFRINRAADDAAGLAISEKLRAQVTGLNTASANAQNAVSLLQTAEGALNETHSILQRMRELAVQSSNDTNVKADREKIQVEVDQLAKELNRIGNTTEFNTQKILSGGDTTGTTAGAAAGKSLTFAIGANKDQTLSVSISDMRGGALGVAFDNEATIAADGVTVTTAQTVLDADKSYGETGTYGINVKTQAAANSAIETINTAIETVSEQRAKLGASQNRLEHTINNLGVAAENLSASESRIRDTDMAKEMMAFTRSQILSQAGTAMLAQANQAPQGVLSLLR